MNGCFNNDLLGLRKRWCVCSNPIPTTQTHCFALVGEKKNLGHSIYRTRKAFEGFSICSVREHCYLSGSIAWESGDLPFLIWSHHCHRKEQVEAPWDFWLGYLRSHVHPVSPGHHLAPGSLVERHLLGVRLSLWETTSNLGAEAATTELDPGLRCLGFCTIPFPEIMLAVMDVHGRRC